jgi:hypothetical protein
VRGATAVCVYLSCRSAHRHELVYPKVQPLLKLRAIHIHDKDTDIGFSKVNPIESVVVFLACRIPDLDCAIVYLFEFAVDVHRLFSHGTKGIIGVSYQK